MTRKRIEDVTGPDALDGSQALLRAAVASVPVLGSAAAELMALVVTPPLEARRNEWLNELAADLDGLRETVDGLQPAELAQNDAFLSAVAVAVGSATRAAEQSKRDMLRNAVVNAALGHVPDFDMQIVFIGYLDYLSPLHMQLLKVFADPRAALAEVDSTLEQRILSGGPSLVVEEVFPQLKERRDVYDFLWQDLYQRSLVGMDSLHTSMSRDGVLEPRTTAIGNQLLAFVAAPPEADSES